MNWPMRDLLDLIRWMLLGLFRSRTSLRAENLALRHQLNLLHRRSPKRPVFSNFDRLIFICLYRIAPRVLDALTIVDPATVVRWHRTGFRLFWRWKSRRRAGRPKVPLEVRQLIREMSLANPLWGAPRIHGELLKLGIDVGQTSVAKYMARRRRPPSQGWRTFLLNHADGIASIDLFMVPTISFRLLYGLLVLRHDRRRILWLGVTAHPTAEWIARQVTEACGWESAPQYIVRDRDRVYGEAFTPHSRDGHSRQTDRAAIAMAERLCRTIDRLDPTRMPGSCDRVRRASSASPAALLRALLQQFPNTPLSGQGLAPTPSRSCGRQHSSAADPRRIAPPLCPDLICDRDRRYNDLKTGSRFRPAFRNASSIFPIISLVLAGSRLKPYQPAPKRTARRRAASAYPPTIIGTCGF
jgi:hypothetical protein